MSKVKKAVKQANKIADKEIKIALKTKRREEIIAWLKKDVNGVKNWHLVSLVALTLFVADVILLNP
nr:hypothetical protein [uncultured Mediterranean phage uvMED]